MSGENWIAVRADCTLESNFREVEKAVREDVKRFNRLAPAKRDGRLFLSENKDGELTIRRAQRVKDHRGQRMVADPDCADDFLTVRCDGATIIAQRQDREPIVIEPRWNRETLTCDLPRWQTAPAPVACQPRDPRAVSVRLRVLTRHARQLVEPHAVDRRQPRHHAGHERGVGGSDLSGPAVQLEPRLRRPNRFRSGRSGVQGHLDALGR